MSALVFQQGRLAWIRHAWMAGRFLPLASRPTTDEILRVLTYPKFQLTGEDVRALLGDYLPFAETVQAPSDTAVPEPPDPDDRIFLELVVVGHAQCLVSGDQGLRAMGSVGDCRILAPAQFRTMLDAPAEAEPPP